MIFGPAGRELPQLPLMIDVDGNLRAAGVFDEDIGPSWWGGAPHMTFIGRAVRKRGERTMRFTEQRLGGAPAYKWMLRYVFPDHWTFLLGEIALYSFMVLIVTRDLLGPVLRAVGPAGRLPRLLRAAAQPGDVGRLPLGGRHLLQRPGGVADPPGAPLGR